MSEIEETAKAVQEASKAAGKVVDAASKAGGFLAQLIREPLSQVSGLLTDGLMYRRWENQQRLKIRALDKMRELGTTVPWHPIPLRVGVPLLEAADVAEEEELQELWANLLVNFGNGRSGVAPQVAFVSILRELSPFDAYILQKIYSHLEGKGGSVLACYLPESVVWEDPVSNPVNPHPPVPHDVQLALANLLRLGCLAPASTWDGGQLLDVVYTSILGKALHAACTLQR